MPITDISCQLDDGLHPLDLALDVFIKVLFLDFRERQEMNRPGILVRTGRNEWSQGLINVLSQEWSIRCLNLESEKPSS